MVEAIFGLVGVLIGSGISWFQIYWTNRQTEIKNAKYLAIRVVCILDKFMEDCAEVVKDDGLSFGQRNGEGCLEPKVQTPGAPMYPEDLDWRSIDHDLMYKLLSLPSEVVAADRMIKFTENIADPPDFEDWFNERKFYYSQFGLEAFRLSEELSNGYSIKKKTYNDWNPAVDLQQELNAVVERRNKRIEGHQHFVKSVLRT